MKRDNLLYKLTGTETPKFITERENVIIDKCLRLINDLESDVNNLDISFVSDSAFNKTKKLLKELTDDERMELFGDYCKYCGDTNPTCQCWNDE